jgi:hypothetical protein
MKTSGFQSFAEFWPYYLSEHRNPLNRRLHFAGTTLTNLSLLAAISSGRPMLLLLCPLFGYAFAWFGHFRVEHNRPATFKHPFYSLAGDYRMYLEMLRGRLWGPAAA